MKCKIMILEVLPNDSKNNREEIYIQTKVLEEVDIQRIIKAVNNLEDIKK